MKALALIATVIWAGLWFTPDQQGRRLFERGEFIELQGSGEGRPFTNRELA